LSSDSDFVRRADPFTRRTRSLTAASVGEVIVRKVIETRMVEVQVPVRHEKLIVEQVSPERKQLAEIDLRNFLG